MKYSTLAEVTAEGLFTFRNEYVALTRVHSEGKL